jgi:molybdate-binding protein
MLPLARCLIVAPGNPRDATSVAALATLRITKREVGAGTRVLLDHLLIATGITPEDVKSPALRRSYRADRSHEQCIVFR